jgi:hypothetical protein
MNPVLPLSLEQEFKVKVFEVQLPSISQEELQELLVDLYENSLVQETLFKQMMGEYLGISPAIAENWLETIGFEED